MNIINLTPHTINIYQVTDLVEIGKPGSNQWALPDGDAPQPIRVIPSEVIPATAPRVETRHQPAGELDGVPCWRAEFGQPYNLPDAQPGTIYIVSALVASAAPDRKDLATVLGGVKDATGRICGCVGLAVR